MKKSLGIGLMLGWQDIRQSYRRSVFGQLWLTIGMAVTITTIGIVFGSIFGTPIQTFLPYLASGLIMWGLIVGILNEGTVGFIIAEGMIKQLPLPKVVYLVRVVWRNIIVSAHNIIIFPVVVLIFGVNLTWAVLLWPIGVIVAVSSLAGLATIFAFIATRFRDLPPIVNAILTVAFYITPVIWIKDSLGDSELVNTIVSFNPLYHLLQIMRLPLLGQYPSEANWTFSIVSAVVFLAIAAVIFKKFEHRIAYWV